MVEVIYNKLSYKPLLGNNMFQYCLGRIIAENLGLALEAEPIAGFPNTAESVNGQAWDAPVQVLSEQIIDLAGVLADRSARRIRLDGWFQRHEYYRPHREKIRQWLAFDPAIRQPDVIPDVVVHVRRTDFIPLGWALPFSYYEEALARLLPQGGKILIMTDDKTDPFFKQFSRWQPTFSTGTAIEDLQTLTRAPKLVMSQSTFSWWATFLGNPEQVACPLTSFGVWSSTGAAKDASLIEHDRFICIECREPYQITPKERRHHQRLAFRRRLIRAVNRRLGWKLKEPRN